MSQTQTIVEICPDSSTLGEMWDALPGRPELTDYAAWLAAGVEAAPEIRAYERRRSTLMAGIYGDVEEAA